jgi:hypothetical protein
LAFSMVLPGLRADSPPGVPERPKPGVIISISRSITQRHTVPPLSNTSPDLTTSTAESTESHTFFFGTGASARTVYARTKWMIGRLARDLGPVRKVVSSMFERLGQATRREVEMNRLLLIDTGKTRPSLTTRPAQHPVRGARLRYSTVKS